MSQTHATVIRNAMLELLRELPGIEWKRVVRVPAPTVQPSDLPRLGVYMMRERMQPDGDGNAGEPSFENSVTYGISILDKAGEVDELDDGLDAKADAILTRLLTDPEFNRVGPGGLFESIEGIDRTRVFPADGETRFAEIRMELTLLFRTTWQPLIPDDYKRTRLQTAPLGSPPGTPRIVTVIDQAP